MTSTVLVLLLAVATPWVFGLMLARWLSGPGSVFLYLGQGYILGTFAVVWLIKAWDAGGLTLHFWPMAGVLLVLTILVAVGTLRQKISNNPGPPDLAGTPTICWQQGIMLLLCLAMGAHLLFVLQELLLRPTFPWDAWRGWEPKVIQFFANRSLDSPMETIGNYGEVSTLAMLWMMLASETSHEPFLHLPWLLAYLALAAIVYGYLRERSSSLVAALGAYLVTSLPYLNSHVALAGYADIWLTLAFTLGVLALSEFRRNHRYRQLVLALLMAAACLQAKRAGMGFAAVILALVVVENRHARTEAGGRNIGHCKHHDGRCSGADPVGIHESSISIARMPQTPAFLFGISHHRPGAFCFQPGLAALPVFSRHYCSSETGT